MRDIAPILRGRALRRQAWKVLNIVVAAVTVFQVSSFTAAAQQAPTTPVQNPSLGQTCGLDIGLVVDQSGSMEPGEVTQMKTALGNFASAFSGTPTVFSLSSFGTSSTLVDPFSLSPAQAATAIDDLPPFNDEEEMTNWEAGLGQGRDSFDPRVGNSNLLVIATDGSPNRFGYPTTNPSGLNYSTALEPAVVMANTIKNAGIRVVVVGIGDDAGDPSSAAAKLDKMKAISGSNVAFTPGDITVSTDVIKVADFDGIGAALASFSHALCPGSITVNKQVDTTGNNQYQDGNQMGFTWAVDGGSASAMGATVSAQPGNHAVTETLLANYQFVGWYNNAEDRAVSCSQPQTLNGTTLPIALTVPPDQHLSITLCNKFVPVAPSLTITKTNNSGSSVNPGATVTYTVVVTNNAAATQGAQNVVMTDTLPLGFTFTVGGGSAKSFNLGTIAPGASVTTAYTVNISSAQAAGTYTNTATAKGDNTVMVSATSNVVVKVPQVLGVAVDPELTLTKSVNPGSTNPGKTVTYTLKVKNTSTADATNVIVTDTLPNGFTFTNNGRSTKTWTFAVLAGGAEQVLTYNVTVGKNVTKGDYVNRAFVTADGLDPISAQANVKVSVPQVKGLADTGVGFNDYAFFIAGLLLIAAGGTMVFRLRRQIKTSR